MSDKNDKHYPLSALNDREEIATTARIELRAKYDHGQREHGTDLPSGGLSWFARAAREEALDLIAYTHHLGKKCEALHELQERMAAGTVSLAQASEELWNIISATPPKKHDAREADGGLDAA